MLASDIAGMVPGAFALLAAVFNLGMGFGVETNTLPFAHPGPKRDDFIKEWTQECHQHNPKLSPKRLDKYCTCLTSELADAVSLFELTRESELAAKVKSVAKQCTAKTLAK